MKKLHLLLIAALAFSLVLSGCCGIGGPAPTPTPNPTVVPTETPVACTADAMICPDGSAVGRIPPDCNFAPCPSPTATPFVLTECRLSLCDCACYPAGMTPEELQPGKVCGINCLGLYGIEGCRVEADSCAIVYAATPTPTPEPTPTPTPEPTPEVTPTPTPTPVPTPTPSPTPLLVGGGEGGAPDGVVWLDYLGGGYDGFRVEIDGIATSSYDRVGVTVAPGERLDPQDPDAMFLTNGPTGTPRNIVIRQPYMQGSELYQWRYDTISGSVSRRSMSVILTRSHSDVARYDMTQAWPYGYTAKVEDGMIAETIYIAIETVQKSM